jgi:hypothetical protein
MASGRDGRALASGPGFPPSGRAARQDRRTPADPVAGAALPLPASPQTPARCCPSLRHQARGCSSCWSCRPCPTRSNSRAALASYGRALVPISFAALYDIAPRAMMIEAGAVRRVRALGVARQAERPARCVGEIPIPDPQFGDGATHPGAGESPPRRDVHARHVLPGRLQCRELSISGRTPAKVDPPATSA